MSDDIEHFFIYLFAMSGEVSVQIFSPFLSWPVCFPSVAFLSSLYILDISPLSFVSTTVLTGFSGDSKIL